MSYTLDVCFVEHWFSNGQLNYQQAVNIFQKCTFILNQNVCSFYTWNIYPLEQK